MKPIPWYEWLYSCTEDGRVWSHEKKCGQYINHEWKFMKATIWQGYEYMNLSKNGDFMPYRVNRLVALTYLPNPHNYPIVRHLDNNKLNNHVSNLEWCTHKTNRQQAHDDGLCPRTDKQREATRKLWLACSKTVCQYTLDNIYINSFCSMCEAYRQTGVWNANISKCIKWELEQAGWYIWKLW